MSKKYYLAADGGGSKLLGILYDEEFNVIRHCKLSGVNVRFKPVEAVKKNLSDMLEILLGDEIKEVEAADLCLICRDEVWRPIIRDDPRIKSVTVRDEPAIAISSAFMRDGIVALSGTGSDVFLMKDGKRLVSVGGWGPLLGDEGSGYDIGLHAIKAAIRDFDGRGKPTALRQLLLDKWNTTSLWDIVFDLARDPDARHKVASLVPMVGNTALEGDAVAQEIYAYAIDQLLEQTYALLRKCPGVWTGGVVIMGGAWKSYSGMFDLFKSELERAYPYAKVIKPTFEPVVGCAICRCFDDGLALEDFKDKILSGFSEFLYKN